MDNSIDNKQESDCDKCREASELQIEDNVRLNRFLRTNDSDESQDSDSSLEVKINLTEEKVTKHSNDQKQTLVLSSNATGDEFKNETNPKLKDSTKANLNKTSLQERDSKINNLNMNWGESVGITDQNGKVKRVVSLSEMKNYLQLRLRVESVFKFYFALIDSRYPQIFRRFRNEQRWRMRYNIFVGGVFGSSRSSESILHVGEIHIYFDIAKDLTHPYYVNCSFYGNYLPIEKEIDSNRLKKMIVKLHSILTCSDMLQLKFPIPKRAFRSCDSLHSKFAKNQNEMMDELNYLNHYKPWIPNGKRFTIEYKVKHSDSYQSYNQPLIPNQGPNARSNVKHKTAKNKEAKRSAIGSQNERRDATKRSQEQPIDANRYFEERIGRRFFAQSRSSNGRFREGFRDKVYANKTQIAVREKVSTNSDHKVSDDKTQTKVFERKTYRRNRSVDRDEGNNDSARSGGHRERRSRSKTRR
jgi:hypothetical protein